MRQFSRRCRHRRLLKSAHDIARLSIMVDFIVVSITLVFMVLGVSYSRVAAQLAVSNKRYAMPVWKESIARAWIGSEHKYAFKHIIVKHIHV